MTEAEWLRSGDPMRMLDTLTTQIEPSSVIDLVYSFFRQIQSPLPGCGSQRKVLLFDCACGRRIWHRMGHSNWRLIELGERFVDGKATQEAYDALRMADHQVVSLGYSLSQLGASYHGLAEHAFFGLRMYGSSEGKQQANLLREIFGNPFRPLTRDSCRVTPSILSIAQAAYDERALPSGELDNLRLAVLSDALEDAGCADADILSHLRSPGPHVRGCWALDLILTKE